MKFKVKKCSECGFEAMEKISAKNNLDSAEYYAMKVCPHCEAPLEDVLKETEK